MAQSLGDRLRSAVDSTGFLRAFRGTAAAGFDDHTGHHRRTYVGGVHVRHTRAVRQPKGNQTTPAVTCTPSAPGARM